MFKLKKLDRIFDLYEQGRISEAEFEKLYMDAKREMEREYMEKEDVCKRYMNQRGASIIGHLERRYLAGEITIEQYKEKKMNYIEMLYQLYIRDFITLCELKDKIDR